MYNVHDVVIPDHQTFCGIKNEFEKLKLRTNTEDKTHPDDGNMHRDFKLRYTSDDTDKHKRHRRAIDPSKKICELYMQVDHQLFFKFNNNTDDMIDHISNHVMAVNSIYSSIGKSNHVMTVNYIYSSVGKSNHVVTVNYIYSSVSKSNHVMTVNSIYSSIGKSNHVMSVNSIYSSIGKSNHVMAVNSIYSSVGKFNHVMAVYSIYSSVGKSSVCFIFTPLVLEVVVFYLMSDVLYFIYTF